jgi:proteic killer suppression protein
MTIRTFLCDDTEALYENRKPKRFRNIEAVAQRKLQMLDDAYDLKQAENETGKRIKQEVRPLEMAL